MVSYKGDIVVSRYNEDISWIKRVHDYRTFIYNKGEYLDNTITLPNVGREAQTYLHHIVHNYENLGDWVFFVQGHPFDHVKNYVEILNGFPNTSPKSPLKIENSIYFLTGGVFSQVLHSRPNGRPHHAPLLDMNEIWINLFKDPPPETYPFTAGAIFAVSRETILNRTKRFYEKCLEFSTSRVHAPWEYERLFYAVFNPENKELNDL